MKQDAIAAVFAGFIVGIALTIMYFALTVQSRYEDRREQNHQDRTEQHYKSIEACVEKEGSVTYGEGNWFLSCELPNGVTP